MISKIHELTFDELDAVSGGDNVASYGEIGVLGMTISVAQFKDGNVAGMLTSSEGKQLGSFQHPA